MSPHDETETETETDFPDRTDGYKDGLDHEVDKMLSKEISRLGIKVRTAVLEEIHGVHCTCPEETPEMVNRALYELAEELDNDHKIPVAEKQAYLRSKQIQGSYVQTKAFRMRFLRASLFEDIPWIAQRLVTFLEMASELFGEAVLRRPVCLEDFSKKELQLLRMGRVQYLPFGDRQGRRVIVWMTDEVWESFPTAARLKIPLYLIWTAGNDVMAQRKGLVLVVWFDKEFTISKVPKNRDRHHPIFATRVLAIHLCSPDTPFYRFRSAVLKMRIGRARKFVQTHLGNSMENRYALQAYGIQVDQLPISYFGKIKAAYVRQWVSARASLEQHEKLVSNGYNPLPNRVIEYPQPEDVVFRPGVSTAQHPGNAFLIHYFTTILMNERERSIDQSRMKLKNVQRKRLVADIKVEIRDKKGGRFLMWNDEGWWNELVDEDLIGQKIEYQLRMVRKSISRSALLDATRLTPLNRPDENELAKAIGFFEECFPTDAASICNPYSTATAAPNPFGNFSRA